MWLRLSIKRTFLFNWLASRSAKLLPAHPSPTIKYSNIALHLSKLPFRIASFCACGRILCGCDCHLTSGGASARFVLCEHIRDVSFQFLHEGVPLVFFGHLDASSDGALVRLQRFISADLDELLVGGSDLHHFPEIRNDVRH